ncbi:MAG TPA: hypothetical protein VLT86_06355 [Vicinamibacterales bacterium]|nr:hypothetical protein [Vicinamibacterales bacterium]
MIRDRHLSHAAIVAAVGLIAVMGAVRCRAGSAHVEPRITDAVLGEDRDEKADGYEIVRKTTVFHPDAEKIVCVFKVEGASLGTSVRGVWIAEDVGEVAPPNYKIAEKTLVLPYMNSGSLLLTRPNTGWPVGSYRLEIYFGAALAKTLKFTVTAG